MNTLVASSLIAAAGIGLGAFGAHGLEAILTENGHVQTWETAVLYHLIHAVALFCLATQSDRLQTNATFWLWTIGILLFSGSLYGLSLAQLRWLGPITPLGGVSLIAGWIVFAIQNRHPLRTPHERSR